MSFQRGRQHYPGEKIQVTLGKELGAGTYGAVSAQTERKLSQPAHLIVSQKPAGFERVVKRITLSPAVAYNIGLLAQTVEDEYESSRRTPHLHMKEPVKQSDLEYYLVMDKLPGEPLDNVLKKMNDGVLPPLTPRQHLSLMIALVRAMQYQVKDCGLVHRDIKPGNIMVDLSDRDDPVVNILDYGFAKDSKISDSGYLGSPGYMAPEVLARKNCTIQSDIFSLGFCLLELLSKDFNLRFAHDHKRNIVSYINGTAKDDPCKINFRDELLPIAASLKGIVASMCQLDPHDRKGLAELEKQMHALRAELEWIGCSKPEKAKRINAQTAAFTVRAALKAPKQISEIKKLIIYTDFEDEQNAVSEFIKTLGMRALNGCKTRAAIVARIHSLECACEDNYFKLRFIKNDLELFKQQNKDKPAFKNEKLEEKVDYCLKVVKRKLEKYNQAHGRSLDDFVHIAGRLDNLLENMFDVLKEMRLSVGMGMGILGLIREKDTQEKLVPTVDSVKEAIAAGVEAEELAYQTKTQALQKIKTDLGAFQQKYKNSKFFRQERLGLVIAQYVALVQSKINEYSVRQSGEFVSAGKELDNFIKYMPDVLGIMIVNRCERVYGRMQHYHLQSSLTAVMNELKKNDNDENEGLRQLKTIIKLAISNYIHKTATGRNLFFHDRAASERRIADMSDILKIVNEADAVSKLKVDLNDRLGQIKTGLFGRSQLRDEVREGLSMHAKLS